MQCNKFILTMPTFLQSKKEKYYLKKKREREKEENEKSN